MSTSGGFWPGEAPAAEQEDVPEPEAPIADPPGWPKQAEEPAAETQPEVEAETQAEEASVAEAAVAQPEPEAEAEAEPEPEAAPAGHVPGELDIPDGVAVLEGSPSGLRQAHSNSAAVIGKRPVDCDVPSFFQDGELL